MLKYSILFMALFWRHLGFGFWVVAWVLVYYLPSSALAALSLGLEFSTVNNKE